MGLNLKAYETQAQLSVIFAIIGGLSALAAAVLVVGAYNQEAGVAFYGSHGRRLPAILAAEFVSLATAVIGCYVGFHSAGQRRNKRSRLSWTGFFGNAAVITFALSIFAFFWMTRQSI